MAEHTYLLGLPVLCTIAEDGTVTYDVDTSEAGAAIRESELDELITVGLVATGQTIEEVLEADAALVDADHDRRMAGLLARPGHDPLFQFYDEPSPLGIAGAWSCSCGSSGASTDPVTSFRDHLDREAS